MMIKLLAQVASGNQLAGDVLNSSLRFYAETGIAWDRIWELVVNPTMPLWIASVAIAKLIFGFSLLFYLYITYLQLNNLSSAKPILDQMPLPLTVALLLSGQGTLLSGLVLGIREIFQYFIVLALQIQIAGISVNEALQQIQSTEVANNRARIIFADCFSKTGVDLTDCVQDPVKIQQVQDLLNQSGDLINGNVLEEILNGITSLPGSIIDGATSFVGSTIATAIGTPVLAIIQFILIAIQHVFINIIEAAAVLTGVGAPIFVGFSLLTIHSPLFVLWVALFMGLYFLQLSYVALIGFYATVVSLLDQAGVPIGTIVLDIAFLLFIALFAPALATAISLGGGFKLYEQISSNLAKGATFLISTLPF